MSYWASYYSRYPIGGNNLQMQNSSLIQALEATAPVCATVLSTMLSSTLGLALPPPPRPHPFCVYSSKVPNGVRFPRCIFCGDQKGVRFPRCIFCGNQHGVRFPRYIFCGNQVPAKLWKIPAPLYFAGTKIPAQHRRISPLHFLRENRSSVAPQDSSGLLKDSSAQTLSV